LAAADIGYVFSSWTGDCSGTNPSTTVFMDAQKACTADFALCGDQPAKNARTTTTYTSLGNTYGDTTPLVGTVDGDTIQLLATTLPETLDLARDISVTLSGGYGCGFTGPASYSIIQGSLTVSSGKVTAEYLIIK
jgi:uncharacterized repeat protein (TIGR02543 family)